ncbi:MAG: DUF2341 domain-containing protein, partial [Candidatus Pacebacteria bacterium]|nr:DUF2341 domain-containing protein [Candidatus Paceibacterota bacterium]
MNIFRYKKRNKQMPEKDVFVHDVLPKNNRTFLDLRGKIENVREHVPIIEIHLEEVMPFARENKKPLTIIAITLMVISSFSMFGRSHASIATFFPTTCLGGWQHPENAQGAPNVDKGAPLERFSSSNSAVLENSSAQIYCGTFSGEIPQDTLPKNFILSFNWSVDNGNIEHDKPQPFETSSGSSSAGEESVLVPVVSTDDSVSTNSSSETSENDSNSSSDTVLSAPPVVPPTESAESVIVTPETPPDIAPPASDTQSFLDIFSINKAQAEDEVPSPPVAETVAEPKPEAEVVEVVNKVPVIEIKEEAPVVTPSTEVKVETPAVEDVGVTPSVETNEVPSSEDVTIGEVSSSEPSEVISPDLSVVASEAPTDIFATVTYTLDGSSWHKLGDVEQSNWQHSRFELPLNAWDDMSHLQVAIASVQSLDTQPILYLDAMQVEVDYEEGKILQKPTVVIQNEDALVLDGKIDFTSEESPMFAVVNPNITASDIAELVKDKKAEVLQDNDKILTDDREEKKETSIEVDSPAKSIVEEIKDIFQIGGKEESTLAPDTEATTEKPNSDIDKPAVETTPLPVVEEVPQVEVIEGTPPAEVPTREATPPVEVLEQISEPISTNESSEITAGLFLRLPANTFSLGANFRKRQENKNKEEKKDPSFAIFSPLIARAAGIFDGVPTISEAKVLDYNGNPTTIKATVQTVTINGESRQGVSIEKPKYKFRPGRYTLQVTIETADAIIVSEQDFTWGVLAINTNKAIFADGDDAYLQMGVLNDSGSTLCNADLDLVVTTPTGKVENFSTSDKTITREKRCDGNTVIDVPDYYMHYKIDSGVGRYKLELTATTLNGKKKIIDGFDVAQVNFDVVREGPTRIYPVSTYPMTFTVTSKYDWSGVIIEKIPASFGVFPPKTIQGYDKVSSTDEVTTITWNVSLKAGKKTTFGYIFKAPEVSPEFYLLGPLSFYAEGADTLTSNPQFQETRRWQLANDAVCGTTTGLTSGNWDGTSPVGAVSVWTGCTGAGGIPGSGDVVTINTGATITLNVNAPASGTLGAFTVAGTLTNTSFTLTTGTTAFTVNNGGTFNAGSGTITSGVIVTNGTYNANSATINVSTPVTASTLLSIGSTGVFDAGSANITLVFGQLSGSTILSLTAGGSFVGGTSTITEGIGVSGSGGTGTATLNSGDFTGSNKLHNFTMNNHGSGIIVLASNIELSGTFTKTTGTFKTDATCTGSLGYDMILSNIVISASGGAADNLCASDITFTGSGTLLSRSTFTLTATNANFIIKSDSSPTFFSGNAVTFTDLTLSPAITANRAYSMGTAPTISGNWTFNPTNPCVSSCSTNTLTFTMSAGVTIGATKTITISTTGSNIASVLDTSGSNYALSAGLYVIDTNGTLAGNGSTITVSGTTGTLWTQSGSTTGASSTVTFTGAANSSQISMSGSNVNIAGNLKFNNASFAAPLSADITIGGTLDVTNGTFNTSASNCSGTSCNVTAGKASFNGVAGAIGTMNSSTLTLNATSGTLFTKVAGGGTYNANASTIVMSSDADITMFGGVTLTVGAVTLSPTLTGNHTYTFGVAPTISSSTLTVNPTASSGTPVLTVLLNATTSIGATSTTLVKASGTATSNFSTSGSNYAFTTGFLSIDSGGTFTANASTVNISATTGTLLSMAGSGIFTRGTSTVNINGSGSNTINTAGYTGSNKLYNMTVNATGVTKTLGGDIEIENQLTLTNGTVDTSSSSNYNITSGKIDINATTNAIFSANASTIELTGTSGNLLSRGSTSVFNPGTATFKVTSQSGTPTFLSSSSIISFHILTIDTTPTSGAGATVINSGSSYNIADAVGSKLYIKYGVYNDMGAGVSTAGSTNNTLQIDANGKLCLGGSTTASTNATCDSSAVTTGSRGLPSFSTYNISTCSGGTCPTVRFLSDASLSGTNIPSSVTYGTLEFAPRLVSTARSYTPQGALTVNGNFTIQPTNGSVLFTVNMAGNITVGSGYTTTISGTTSTSKLCMRATTCNSGSSYDLSTGLLNVASQGTLDATGASSTITLTGTSGTLFTRSGTFTITSGTPTVTLSGNGSATLNSGTITFYNLTSSGTGIKTLAATITVNNNLTISSGTLDDAGNQITGNVTGNLTMSSGTILILGTTGTATTFPTLFTNAHCPIDAGATVTYNATVAQTISGVPNYGGLRLSAASGTPTKTLGAQVTINSTLTVDANNTLDVGSGLNYGIILAGNFTNNGTFTARAGTVSLVGTTTQTLTGNFTTASSSAFYNLSISNTSGADPSGAEVTGMTASVDFAGSATVTNNYSIAPTCTSSCTRVEYNSGSTYTFTNVTWTGAAAHKIYFRNSATSGTWLLNVSGTQSITYVDVSRSDASSGSTINATGTGNTDSGNNVNWAFTLATISGNAYNDGATTTWAECDGTNANISLVVNGGTASTTTCNASTGAYSFGSVLIGGSQPISVHFNTTSNPSDKGVVITKTASSPSATITGLNPHKGYVWLQEETSATALTNTNLDHCDSGVAGCTNVPYVVTSGNLTVDASYELRITSTATFAPAGNVSASTINLAGTYTGNTETITLSGTSGTLFTRTGTFTQGTTEVIVTSASGTPTLLSTGTTFHRLTINSAATIINAGAAITMSSADSANRLYLQDGVLNDGGNQITGTANGTLVMDSDTALCIGGTTSSTSATCDSGATQTTATTFPTNYTTGNITMAAGSATSGWYNASWGYRTKITIDHTKVPSTQTDFPVLISKKDARFKTVANSGHMGNAGATDLVVTSSDGTTKLNHEIEYYVATTGELLAWVKVPSLSSSADTDLYLYYGNAGVADQQNVTGTWNSNFKQVLHVKDGTTLSVTDSTGSYNGTNSGGTATTGKIDGGVDFNLSSHISNGGTIYTMTGGSTAHTISFWVNMDDFSGGDQYVWDGDTAAGIAAFMNIAGAGIIQWGFTAGGYRSYTSTPISSTGTWYHVVAQKTSSGDNGNLYVNGTLQSTYTGTLGNPANTGSSNSQWGRYHATALSADGKMDEMRVYNIATSANWITTEYNNQSSPSTFIPTWATEEVGTIPDATVYYLANDAMTISAVPNYRAVKFTPLLTGSETYTLGGVMTINGDWTINPNSAGANTLTVDAGGAITVASTKTTTLSRQGSSAFAILDLRVSATDYDLTTGFLNIATGGTLDAGSSGSGLDITLNGISGTLFTKVGTFTEGDATVNITSASGTPTVFSAATTVHILKINSGATVVNAGANITTDNDSGNSLWIASGVFNQESRTITAGTAGTLQIDSGGTLCLGGTTTATNATCDSGITQTTAQSMPSFTTYTFDTSSTVI